MLAKIWKVLIIMNGNVILEKRTKRNKRKTLFKKTIVVGWWRDPELQINSLYYLNE